MTFPATTTIQEYKQKLNEAAGVYFGVGSRGIMMRFTVYHRTTDYWVSGTLLFEYDIEDQVFLANKIYEPFRPHNYETEREKRFFVLDIVRTIIGVLLQTVSLIAMICNSKRSKQL
jgi:hypothetical protein